jgi:hypothetical protein
MYTSNAMLLGEYLFSLYYMEWMKNAIPSANFARYSFVGRGKGTRVECLYSEKFRQRAGAM